MDEAETEAVHRLDLKTFMALVLYFHTTDTQIHYSAYLTEQP